MKHEEVIYWVWFCFALIVLTLSCSPGFAPELHKSPHSSKHSTVQYGVDRGRGICGPRTLWNYYHSGVVATVELFNSALFLFFLVAMAIVSGCSWARPLILLAAYPYISIHNPYSGIPIVAQQPTSSVGNGPRHPWHTSINKLSISLVQCLTFFSPGLLLLHAGYTANR